MNEIIVSYTRAQAIADGVLRDASGLAIEAGFNIPVAVTAAVWTKFVAVPDRCPWQDETGRLWDILNCLRFSIRQSNRKHTQRCDFVVYVQNDNDGPRPVDLKALCHPGDNFEPVVTIMLPTED